ncbi:C-GCAxxG-C-C family (seleno)protein [Thermovibrio sp.]
MELAKIIENMEFIRETFGERSFKEFNLKKIAVAAYKYYWDYNCEYGIITAFSQEAQLKIDYQEVKSFTKELPNRWSSICGAITGAYWVFALTLAEEEFERVVVEINRFHNETPLPLFTPKVKLPKAPALSTLCRDSIVNWCKATGIHPRSPERSYRCASITADIAVKCGQIVKELLPV